MYFTADDGIAGMEFGRAMGLAFRNWIVSNISGSTQAVVGPTKKISVGDTIFFTTT